MPHTVFKKTEIVSYLLIGADKAWEHEKKVQIVNIYDVCFWNHENILNKIGCALSLESYL